MKKKVGGMRYIAGGEGKTGAGEWGSGDEGLHAADACQHHSLNMSLGSKRCRNSEK
jgi:hypothetical protein